MKETVMAVANNDMSNVYLIVGTLTVMNLGVIATGIGFIIKLVWVAAKYDSRFEKMENDVKKAFERIRWLEGRDRGD